MTSAPSAVRKKSHPGQALAAERLERPDGELLHAPSGRRPAGRPGRRARSRRRGTSPRSRRTSWSPTTRISAQTLASGRPPSSASSTPHSISRAVDRLLDDHLRVVLAAPPRSPSARSPSRSTLVMPDRRSGPRRLDEDRAAAAPPRSGRAAVAVARATRASVTTSYGADRQPGAPRARPWPCALSMASGRREDPGADVGDAGHLEQALDACRPRRTARAAAGRRRRPRRAPAGPRRARCTTRPPAVGSPARTSDGAGAVDLGEHAVGDGAAASASSAASTHRPSGVMPDRHHVVAVAVERREDAARADAGDGVLAAAARRRRRRPATRVGAASDVIGARPATAVRCVTGADPILAGWTSRSRRSSVTAGRPTAARTRRSTSRSCWRRPTTRAATWATGATATRRGRRSRRRSARSRAGGALAFASGHRDAERRARHGAARGASSWRPSHPYTGDRGRCSPSTRPTGRLTVRRVDITDAAAVAAACAGAALLWIESPTNPLLEVADVAAACAAAHAAGAARSSSTTPSTPRSVQRPLEPRRRRRRAQRDQAAVRPLRRAARRWS